MPAVLLVVPVIVAAALMQLFGAYLLPAPSPVIKADPAGIVALENGTTIRADQGTIGRDIVDWLNSNRAGERLFEVGGYQFAGDTAVPTAESRGRLHRLAMMLRAEKAVTAKIIVYSDGRDRRVAEQRARLVVRALMADEIAADRLGFELRAFSPASRHSQPVAILLARPGARSER